MSKDLFFFFFLFCPLYFSRAYRFFPQILSGFTPFCRFPFFGGGSRTSRPSIVTRDGFGLEGLRTSGSTWATAYNVPTAGCIRKRDADQRDTGSGCYRTLRVRRGSYEAVTMVKVVVRRWTQFTGASSGRARAVSESLRPFITFGTS